jgi:hypothetical protein
MELNLKLDNDVVVEQEQDRIGSGKYTLDTGIYDMVIKLAYLSQSKGGATAVNFTFETKDGKSLRQTIYITNKKGETFYIGKSGNNAGKKVALPGYLEVNSICQASVGKSLEEVYKSVAKKKIKIRDFSQKIDVLTEVDMLMDLVAPSAKIILGIQECKVNKQVQNSQGIWIDGPEEQVINEIHKVYHPGRLTAKEVETKVSTPEYATAWLEKYEGQLIDRYKPVAGSSTTSTNSSNNLDPFA